MKKNFVIIIISLVIVVLGIIGYKVFVNDSDEYTIKVRLIDSYSPDRKIELYDKNNKIISFKEVYSDSDVVLCTGKNPVISSIELINIKKMKVKLENDKIITATIMKEEE